jgi:GT2 family glycosyltransferase
MPGTIWVDRVKLNQENAKINVMIVTHDRHEYVQRALESCRRFLPNSKVYVADNGEIGLPENIIKRYKNIVYFRLEKNTSVHISRNFLYKKMDSQFILNLDDDAYVDQTNFEQECLSAIERYSNVGIINLNLKEDERLLVEGGIRKVSYFFEGASLFNREIIKAGILYMEDQDFLGGENIDFLLRTLNKEYECIVIPGMYVIHTPDYEKRPQIYTKTKYKAHLVNNLTAFCRYFSITEAIILCLGTLVLYLINALKTPWQLSQIGATILHTLQKLPSQYKNRRVLSRKTRSRFLFCGAYDQLPESKTPENFSAFGYLLSKLSHSRKSLTIWNH